MFEQTSYKSPVRHESMTSFHRWSSNRVYLCYWIIKCYMFYLWKRGCVGALTAEALQVQRGEEEEEGAQGWGDQNYGWSMRSLCFSSYPELVAYHQGWLRLWSKSLIGPVERNLLALITDTVWKVGLPPSVLFWNKNQDHIFAIKVLKSMRTSLRWLKTCQHNIRRWGNF